MKKRFYAVMASTVFAALPIFAQDVAPVTATFEGIEGITLNANGFYMGEKKGEGTVSQYDPNMTSYNCNYIQTPFEFQLTYTFDSKYKFDSFYGVGVSSVKSTDNNYVTGEFANVKGGGFDGSENFGVVCGNYTEIGMPKTAKLKEIYITNSAKVADVIKNGGSYARALNQEGDFFKVTIEGYGEGEDPIATAEVMLAEFKDGTLTMLEDWTKVDLSTFPEGVETLLFMFSGSDKTDYGMLNTPIYCCIDNLMAEVPVTKVEKVDEAGNAKEVARYNANGVLLKEPQRGLNIIRMSDGTVKKVTVK